MKELKEKITEFIKSEYDITLDSITLETPPNRALGDYACTVCFDLARKLKNAPRKIAEEIVAKMSLPDSIHKMEIAGPGYINFYLERENFTSALLKNGFKIKSADEIDGSIIVEHTSINPNKTPHVGHLRNSVLGDTIARLGRNLGYDVIVQNYIDDTGVQVADVVVGLTEMKSMTLEDIKSINEPLDRYCWDVYSDVSNWYHQDESRGEIRSGTLHALESGEGDIARTGDYVSKTIVKAHIELMKRIDIEYNLLVLESDVLGFKLWDDAFEKMKETGLIYYADEGDKKGCWVMNLKDTEMFKEMDDPDKILVRSNGTVTYTGKDIGYHYWKCGLIEKDFNYSVFHTYQDGSRVWTTTPDGEPSARKFNGADIVINVIDIRQSYPQKVVKQAITSLDPQKELHHFAYEMVALSPSTAEELGLRLSDEDKKKKFIEMSGRKGLGVKADDLLDSMILKSVEKITANNPELDKNTVDKIAEQVTVGALRYFLLKFNKNKVIAFDLEEALNFEGDTGPYIQYSLVRVKSILRKYNEKFGTEYKDYKDLISNWDYNQIGNDEESGETWDILFQLSGYEDVLNQVFSTLEFSILSSWMYTISQKFNSYYHKYNILQEEKSSLRENRLSVALAYLEIMSLIVEILGIPVPDKM